MKVSREYIAGLFDGEGVIGVSKTKQDLNIEYIINVSLRNKSKTVLSKINDQYAGDIVSIKNGNSSIPVFCWSLVGKNAVEFLRDMTDCLIIKKTQAQLALSFSEFINSSSKEMSEFFYQNLGDMKRVVGYTATDPQHYRQGGIEVIDFILDWNFDYLQGNVIKYISRYKYKNGIEDLRKARWYVNKLISVVEAQEHI
ncbi:MAG: DUF3310 domain-containing protein [Halobacteriota archaeon]|nr:DUF3310 domain-containing protein [Halobacteriota archaeon]